MIQEKNILCLYRFGIKLTLKSSAVSPSTSLLLLNICTGLSSCSWVNENWRMILTLITIRIRPNLRLLPLLLVSFLSSSFNHLKAFTGSKLILSCLEWKLQEQCWLLYSFTGRKWILKDIILRLQKKITNAMIC